MQKNAELFLFFKIADADRPKVLAREHMVGRLATGRSVHECRRIVAERSRLGEPARESWLGLNLAFTKDGMTQLLGANRPEPDPSFERGADLSQTIATFNDPPPSKWPVLIATLPLRSIVICAGLRIIFLPRRQRQID